MRGRDQKAPLIRMVPISSSGRKALVAAPEGALVLAVLHHSRVLRVGSDQIADLVAEEAVERVVRPLGAQLAPLF